MKKKISNALRKPFKSGSSSSATIPLLNSLLQDLSLSTHDFDLISERIKQALDGILPESKDEFQLDSRLAFILDAGSQVLEKFEKTADRIKKQASPDGMSVVANTLGMFGNVHYVGMCLSVVAVAITSYQACTSNRTECKKLLQTCISLMGLLKELSLSPSFLEKHAEELDNAAKWILYSAIKIISMTSRSQTSRYLYALIDKKDLDNIHREVHETFPQLCLSTAISLLNLAEEKRYYKPKHQETSNIVGMDSLIEEVMKDLNLQQVRDGCTCVCVHAMGGAGKSTLADTVYSNLSQVKGYYHCKVELALDETDTTLIKRQKEILEKLLGSKVPQKIGNMKDGKYLMKEEIEKLKKPVFLVLDNLNLSLDQVQFVLPKLHVFNPGSAILVTTRYKGIQDSLKGLGFSPLMREVPLLGAEEARILLYQSMGCDPQLIIERVREEWKRKVVDACCGLPLALKVAGGFIRGKQGVNDEEVWEKVVESLREGRSLTGDADEKDPLLRSLKLSIDALSTDLRDCLFDIISFSYREEWWYVAYAVGKEAIEDLKARHLIQEEKRDMNFAKCMGIINDNNELIHHTLTVTRFKVHDVVNSFGWKRMKEKGEAVIRSSYRFKNLETFDSMKLQNIRWIKIREEEKQYLSWSLLCRMENIRMLSGVVVEHQKSTMLFESLKVFSLDGHHSEFPFSLENAPNLRILKAQNIHMQEMKVPKGLKYLRVDSCLSLPSFQNGHLEYLHLIKCDNLVKLEGIQHLRSLKHLVISQCNKLRAVEGLLAVESLHIGNCQNLECVKSCNFSALRYLQLFTCWSLEEISFDFESLRYLRITCCPYLRNIPDALKLTQIVSFYFEGTTVKQLPIPHLHWTHQQPPNLSLRHISLANSKYLKELPEVFFCYYPNLETLDLSFCKNLISLPEDNCRGTNSQLRILRLNGCISLETLDVSHLSRLEELDVSSSTNLITCCISELQPVEILNFSHCWKLESLRSMSIFSLRCLKKLSLEGCWRVKKEVEGILQSMPPSMEEINVRGCLHIEEVEECIPNKKMDVQVISQPSFWRNESSDEEKMEKMGEVLQSLCYLDSMANIIPGIHLQGKLVCLLLDWMFSNEKILENVNAMHSELENAGKPLQFIYISKNYSKESILMPDHCIKVSPYHASSLLSLNFLKWSGYEYGLEMLITTVGNGSAHVICDAKVLRKQFGLEGYPFTTDVLARVGKPLTLSFFLGSHTTLLRPPPPECDKNVDEIEVTPDQLTGKLVAVYSSFRPIPFFTQVTHAGEHLQFIWVPSFLVSDDNIHEKAKGHLVCKMDPSTGDQWYVYGGLLNSFHNDSMNKSRQLLVFDQEGNMINPNAWEACMRYGVANAFPFTPDKIASLPRQRFLNSTLHFLLWDTKLQTTTPPTTQVSLESMEGTIVCFIIVRILFPDSLEKVVKDYQNLKLEWKEQLRVVCFLDTDLEVQPITMIPDNWLMADSSFFSKRERLEIKEDKHTRLLEFLIYACQWSLGFDGDGEMIRERDDTRLFGRYLLEEQQVYNEEDGDDEDTSSNIGNEVGTMSLNSKISKGWDNPSPINHPQHPTCQLYICLLGTCYICNRCDVEWLYGCSMCRFYFCLDCQAKM